MNRITLRRPRRRYVAVFAALALSLFSQPILAQQGATGGDGPDTSALIFGRITYNDGVPMKNMVFAQIDPKYEPTLVAPNRIKHMFYLDPVAVGSDFKLIKMEFEVKAFNNVNYIDYSQGPQNFNGLDIVAEKPGLLYVGDIDVSMGNRAMFATRVGVTITPYEYDAAMELDLLSRLLGDYKKTAWEPVIAARIEELKNAK